MDKLLLNVLNVLIIIAFNFISTQSASQMEHLDM